MAYQRRAGVASLTIDGVAEDVVGDLSYDSSKVLREGLSGQNAPHGFKEMPKHGSMGAKVRMSTGRSLAEYNAMTDSTIVAILANGRTVSGSNMFQVGELKVDSMEGTLDLMFNGLVEES